MTKRMLVLFWVLALASAFAQLQPRGIIVNPTPPQDLQVRVWVDKDPNKQGNPVYAFGESIRISVQVTQQAYVYLFGVRSTGEIDLVLPNQLDQNNQLAAGELRTFPPQGANYQFQIGPPAGQDRVLAVVSRVPLNLSDIADIQSGNVRIQGADNLARALAIVVTPVPRNDWVTNEAFYFAGQVIAPVPTTGTLVVNSRPAGAEVLVNGSSVGNSPLSIDLQAGNYTVELRRSGFNSFRTTVSIQGGQTVQINQALVAVPPPTGTLAVTSNPSGAQVLVDGRFRGNTPLVINLNTGNYTVELRRSGFNSFRTTVSIQGGRQTPLNAVLTAVAPPPPSPTPPVVVPNPGPDAPSGAFTYFCTGGRLSVTYRGNQVTIFYDGANRLLNLTRNNPTFLYTDGTYTWDVSGNQGRLSVRGQLADTCTAR
ncbi:MAG: PEGA domain-containing protein [Meiothermus sp.]|nr:PEGA domain-containing protein [Meiothermus sp.]